MCNIGFWSLILGIPLIDEFNDVSTDFGNIHPWKPPHQRLSIRAHQKLLEVPLDVIHFQRLPKQPVGGVSEAVADRWASILNRQKEGLG